MLDLESLLSGKPIPPVDANDVKRIWELTFDSPEGQQAPNACMGWDVRLVIEQCSQGADPLAVFFRASLLKSLREGELPDEWRDGGRFHDVVFQTLATFPLPEGIQSFRPDEFVEALRKGL